MRRMRKPFVAVAIVAVAVVAAGLTHAWPFKRGHRDARPNLVVVLVDDQALNTFNRRVMPETFARVVDPGTRFSHGLAVPPLCCPYRAGLLTGQYPHNHGALKNDYALLREKENVLPVWLRRAGYRTGLVGELMNEHQNVLGDAGMPPGWDRVFLIHQAAYYGYSVNDQGELREFGYDADDYSTDVLNREATAFIQDAAATDRPFFLLLAHVAPHNSRTEGLRHPCHWRAPMSPPGYRDWGEFRDDPLPRPASFDEADIADKRAEKIVDAPRISPRGRELIRKELNCTKAAMRAVDRGIADLDQALDDADVADNTVVVYASDNGLFHGQHRLENKGLPYEPAWRVPMAIRAPARAIADAPSVVGDQASNIDLAPTFLELAHATPCDDLDGCRRIDGRSLMPLLQGQDPGAFRGRGVLSETGYARWHLDCRRYTAFRDRRWTLMRHNTWDPDARRCRRLGEELYDRWRDPEELDNRLAGPIASQVRREHRNLSQRLDRLEDCSGHDGPVPCE
jgi:N-acetylglucosamine-6-sulfatase